MKGRHQYSLIRELYTTMPRGIPLDMPTLQKIGISNQRAANYAKSGWLTRVAHGVYALPNEPLGLPAALSYLSRNIDGLHIGGSSSLLTHTGQTLVLWGDARLSLPRWFSERFGARYTHARLFDWSVSSVQCVTLMDASQALGGIQCSTPERALLEMLYEIGGKQSLEGARQIFSQVGALCPDTVGYLLKCCTSVKAVRLFLKWARETGVLNVDEVLRQHCIPVGSTSRWITRLKDGSMLSLKPYG
ncbi:type IV toxin-antitoxin system AbiEi family antitoxin domain-containing protein [Pseudomonas sp. R4-83]|uniref:type IV toxin-antitoxin system AbiEi family antitoxin domain-containing protein n=1 Tax=unclassified Pseudomonas TaxID=196821 RepID=UPI003DA805A2